MGITNFEIVKLNQSQQILEDQMKSDLDFDKITHVMSTKANKDNTNAPSENSRINAIHKIKIIKNANNSKITFCDIKFNDMKMWNVD